MGDNIDVKFGAPPPLVYYTTLQQKVAILAGQFILCVVLLTLIGPPFVSKTASNGSTFLDHTKVVSVSLMTTISSLVLHVTNTNPKDSFMKSCEFLYRIAKS